MIKKIRTVLIGLGNVNQGLLQILSQKEKEIADKYGLQYVIVAVADSSGFAVKEAGFRYQDLIDLKVNGGKVNQLQEFVSVHTEQIGSHVSADLLMEASPVNLKADNPTIQILRLALAQGWNVVLANKSPLVLAYDELLDLARRYETKISYSATVCGGLPVINVLQRDLKIASLKSLHGIFNATTNFVLQEMENGGTMEEAIKEAQRIGAAETDPSLDISGQDAANKLFIIMKSFTDFNGSIEEIKIQGIQDVAAEELAKAAKSNRQIKLVAEAHFENNQWQLSVKPTMVARDSFLGSCKGWEMGIEVKTDLYESISMKNYEADPLGTCAAVLRDAIDQFV